MQATLSDDCETIKSGPLREPLGKRNKSSLIHECHKGHRVSRIVRRDVHKGDDISDLYNPNRNK